MKIELLKKMIEICEQVESYENQIESIQWSLDFGFQGTFPELARKLTHKKNIIETYIVFLNDKLNLLKEEL